MPPPEKPAPVRGYAPRGQTRHRRSIYVPVSLYEKIDALAAERNHSTNIEIVHAIERYVEQELGA